MAVLVVMLDTHWLQSDVSNNDKDNNSNNNNHHDHHHRTERDNLTVFTISSLLCELSATHTLKWPRHSRVQITCNTSGTHRVHHFVFHLVQRGSSAIKMDRVEIAFSLVIFYGLKRLNNEEREKTGVPRENPGQQASENVTY